MNRKNIALIFAGGTGQRVGSTIPKQFLEVCGKEIIVHTIELFEKNSDIDEIYVVCLKNWIGHVTNLARKNNFTKITKIIPGGKTGQDSIYLGLSEIKKQNDDAIVLIHDGVRPLVSPKTISSCAKTTLKYGSAVPALPAYETPIYSHDGDRVEAMPERGKTFLAQAPQGFLLNDILNAHLKERKTKYQYNDIVDSCGLMFKYGYQCKIIEGNPGNIKVTTPSDFFTLISNLNIKDYEQLINLSNRKRKK